MCMRLIDADALIEKLEAWKKEAERRDANINYTFASAIIAQVNAEPTIEERKWIPCSERLPEESGRYLISVLDGVGRRTTVAPYQPRYKAWTMTGRMAYWKVIAWMPLPESYRAERRTDEKKDI